MVDITPLIRSDRQVIQAYKNGVFKISNVIYDQPVIVFPDRVELWPVTADQIVVPDDETVSNDNTTTGLASAMAPIVLRQGEVELLLLGTSLVMHPLQPALKAWFKTQGVRVEVMDTGAASRTYNVLLAEGRLVAAALLLSV